MEPRSDQSARVVLPGFVSTAVLTSSDGLFGDNVEETRITEAPVARPEDAVDYKPLYERLQEHREKKDSEWKEKNNPFAPPKALDDEEIQFIRDLEEREAETQQRRKEQYNEDLAGFLLAKQQAVGSANATTTTNTISSKNSSATAAAAAANGPVRSVVVQPTKAPLVVRAKKRKVPPAKATATAAAASAKKRKDTTSSSLAAPAAATTNSKTDTSTAIATPSIGLVAYGSDSDSD